MPFCELWGCFVIDKTRKVKFLYNINKIPFVKKDYDSTRIYRNTQKKKVRHRLMTHPHYHIFLLLKPTIICYQVTLIPNAMLALELRGINSLLVLPKM